MGKRKTRNKLKKIHNIEKSSAKKTKTSIILDQILPKITKKFLTAIKTTHNTMPLEKYQSFPIYRPKNVNNQSRNKKLVPN